MDVMAEEKKNTENHTECDESKTRWETTEQDEEKYKHNINGMSSN